MSDWFTGITILSYKLVAIVAIIIWLLTFTMCQNRQTASYVFTFGHVANENHTWHLAALYFDSLLNARTNGKVRVQVFPSEQLGKEVELIRSIKSGIADMTVTGGTLQNWVQEAAFSDMPFLFRDTGHLNAVATSDIGKYIEDKILEKSGLRVVCYFERGPRHLTSNRPVSHPSDLKGLIVRIPNVPTYVAAWKSLGAKPIPMALSEVFTALQQGTIEAQENPMAMIYSSNFQEVQKYVNLTTHVISWGYVVIGEKQFQRLPHDLGEIFLQSASDMQAYEHQLFLRNEEIIRSELETRGMKFIEADLKAFHDQATRAVFNSLGPEMQKLYLEIGKL